MRLPLLIAPILLVISSACNNSTSTASHQETDSIISVMRKELAAYFIDNRKTEAIEYLNRMNKTVLAINDPALISVWSAYKGYAFVFQGNPDSAWYYLQYARQIAEKNKLTKALLIAQIHTVSYFFHQQKFDSAYRHALNALEFSKATESPAELPLLYRQLAILYHMANDSTNYRHYLLGALQIAKDSGHIATLSSEIGRYYIDRNRLDSAEYFYKNFQQFNRYAGNYIDARKMEDFAHLLMSQGRLTVAVNYFKEAIRLYKRDNIANPTPYFNIAVTSIDLRILPQANSYLDSAMFIYKSQNDIENVSNCLFQRSRILLAEGKSVEAYGKLDSSYIYHLQYDTIAFRNNAREIDSKISQDKIAALSANMETTKKINNQQLFIIIALSASAVLLIIVGLLLIRRRKMQLLLREAGLQQQLLRSQMDPHFVINSLGTLQAIQRTGDTEKAIDFLNKFSGLIRISLDNARKSFVPLIDEVKALRAYLELQAAQRENGFDYFIETYAGFEKDTIFIPPMLLQPFVENSIVHGFANLNERGWITVKIIRNADTLRCIIEDNGTGLNGAGIKGNKRSLSTGVTRERLQLLGKLAGKQASLIINDKSVTENAHGTLVTLDIPFQTFIS